MRRVLYYIVIEFPQLCNIMSFELSVINTQIENCAPQNHRKIFFIMIWVLKCKLTINMSPRARMRMPTRSSYYFALFSVL